MKNIWLVVTMICLLFIAMGCSVFDLIPGVTRSGGDGASTLPAIPKITNWVMTLSILTIAISVVAFLNGSKSALSGVAGGVVALILAITIQRYAHVIAFVGVIGAFGFLIWTVWIKHTALRENVGALLKVNEKIMRIGANRHVSKETFDELVEVGNNLSKRTQTIVRKLNGNNK